MAEQEFTLQEEFEQEFNAYPEVLKKPPSVSLIEMAAVTNAARLGADVDFIRQELARVGTSFLEAESRGRIIELAHQDFKQELNQAIEVSSLPDITAAEDHRIEKTRFAEETGSPEVYALARDKGGNLYDHMTARAQSRYATLLKLIDERVQEEDVSVWSVLGDIGDILVTAPVDAVRLGGFSRADTAGRIHGLMVADISEEEFQREAKAALDEIADAGILQDSNYLFLMSGAQNLEELGEGLESTLDKSLNVVDLVTLGGFAANKALRGTALARNTTSYVTGVAGPTEGGKVLRDAFNKPNTLTAINAGVAEESLPAYARHPRSFGKEQSWVAPGAHIAKEAETRNTFLGIVRSLGFSRRIDPKVLDEWAPEGIKRLRERIDAETNDRIIELSIDVDDQDNIFGRVTYGRSDGMPFGEGKADTRASRGSAQKLANQVGGTVRAIDRGGREYYVVDVTHNLPTEGLARELTNNEIGTSFLRAFGGTFLTIPRRLDALAKRGEGVAAIGAKRMGAELRAALSGVKDTERTLVEKIFTDMRDGTLSHLRRPLNLPEFRSEWARYSDTPPSQAAENMYLKVQEFNDALYFLKADEVFKRTNNEGFTEVVSFRMARQDGSIDDFELVSKRIDGKDATDKIINPITGEQWTAENIPKEKKVFQVLGGYKVGDKIAKYVAFDTPTVRRTFHTDVLGYNPGGPRGYEFLNHTVKQDSFVTLLSDKEVAARPRTILGTATRQEAEVAVNEINAIFKAARELAPGITRLPMSRAISALADLDLEDVIALNNTWNTNIETTEQLAEFLRGAQIHPGKNVGTAPMDAPLAIADDADQLWFPFGGSSSNRDLFDFNLNSPKNSKRRDKPLAGFGDGLAANTRSPLDMIQNDYLRTLHSQAFSAYNFQSVTGWIKGANQHIINRDKLVGLNPKQYMDKAEFGPKPSKEAENYMAARDAINRTLGTETSYERMWNAKMDRLAEWVYDKGKKKRALTVMRHSKNPLEFLRGWSFDARLGLLSLDQLIVQSSQSANILAIMGPSRVPEWLQAMSVHLPLRLAMHTINTHGFEAATENLRAIGRRTSAFTGMSEEEFVEFARFVNESGRLEVGGEVAELSAVSPVLARGMFSKARMGARVFFNEGEKVPRSAATRVAWNEYKKAFPKSDPFSDHGINWIAARQDALTAAMTRASAATWQRGPLSIPMQFMSYITRMMESLFTDRLLTRKERARLAIAQIGFWGAAGTGFGTVLDAYLLENGYELDSTEYTALRYGLLDTLIQTTTGSEAVFGGRLAPAEGIQQLIDNWRDDNFVEVFAGPAGALIKDTVLALWEGMKDAATGNFSMTEHDLSKTLRYISTYDDVTRAWLIHSTGDYISRNGDRIISGLTNTDALMIILGAQMENVNLQYSRLESLRDQNKAIQDVTTRVKEIIREHNEAIQNGDLEQARELQKLIAFHTQRIPTWALERYHRELNREWGTMFDRTLGVQLERGYGIINKSIETNEFDGNEQ